MPFYECVFIVRQDIPAADVDKMADKFSDLISSNGGKITKRENWGLRNLAYRIQKNRKGHYVLLEMDTPFEAVKELERQMGISEDILRFMTIKLDKLSEGPSAILAKNKDTYEDAVEAFEPDEVSSVDETEA
jgi:small subunit ribosomal protein S6